MVDTVDSKSAARKGVRVQVPPGVQNGGQSATVFLFIRLNGNFKNIIGSRNPTLSQLWVNSKYNGDRHQIIK